LVGIATAASERARQLRSYQEQIAMDGSGMTIEERVIVFIDVHNYSMAFDELLESCEFLQEMYEKLGDLIVGYGGEIVKYLETQF
jgi:hypothetical protein